MEETNCNDMSPCGMFKKKKLQAWVSWDVWAMPLSLGWVSPKHLFLQILCFNLTIDF